jgi:hypothetical protein
MPGEIAERDANGPWMALVSAVLGSALAHAAARPRVLRLVPLLGSVALAFGVWYAGAVVYAG